MAIICESNVLEKAVFCESNAKMCESNAKVNPPYPLVVTFATTSWRCLLLTVKLFGGLYDV